LRRHWPGGLALTTQQIAVLMALFGLINGALRPQQIMIEFANGLDRFLQLLVIA
jgi:hypothetical protein